MQKKQKNRAQAGALVAGVTCFAAVILNYLKRDAVEGSFLESHFNWQVRTFWFSLLWSVLGFATFFVGVGVPILFANVIWYIYRIARGWLALNDGQPMPASKDSAE
jgi:uncharacterized membrane protein